MGAALVSGEGVCGRVLGGGGFAPVMRLDVGGWWLGCQGGTGKAVVSCVRVRVWVRVSECACV